MTANGVGKKKGKVYFFYNIFPNLQWGREKKRVLSSTLLSVAVLLTSTVNRKKYILLRKEEDL